MKKILLATTLLAASAGFAAAEVAVTGSARMGVTSDTVTKDALGAIISSGDAMFSSRVRIVFTATGETDSGLSFGASVRNDQSGVGGTTNGDSTVFISGAFGKLTMGDTGNAADSLVGQVSSVGYTGLGSRNEISWLNKDVTGAQYEYSAGALTFALGLGQANKVEDFQSVAVKYSTDAYSVALGYENNNSVGSEISLSGSATFSGATVKAKIVDGDATVDTAYALSADYNMNGVGLTAFYADHGNAITNYGIGASYDLGGGASVAGGIVDGDDLADPVFDLGVKMSF
jgi:outer membrane protein OmpU